jgi:hypothetical protein
MARQLDDAAVAIGGSPSKYLELSLHRASDSTTTGFSETYHRVVTSINNTAVRIDVTSPSTRGLMYALQDIQRHIDTTPALPLQTITQSPHFEYRALKFNLPWGAYAKGMIYMLGLL